MALETNTRRLLVPKLELGDALVSEAVLRKRGNKEHRGTNEKQTKQTFQDVGIPKLELGNEVHRYNYNFRSCAMPFTRRVQAL
jgi:hypothetical protein